MSFEFALSKGAQIAFRKLLSSDSGMEVMLYLRQTAPSVTKGESHDIIFEAGVVEGYRRAIDKLSSMAALPQEKEESFENF